MDQLNPISILEWHLTSLDTRNESNNNEEDKQDAESSSSGDNKNEHKVKKMDEENVNLLKMLEKERAQLEKATCKDDDKKEEVKSEKSEESFDMFNVDSENENEQDFIDQAVKKGFKVDTQDINVDADGYYQPKAGEIIEGKFHPLNYSHFYC